VKRQAFIKTLSILPMALLQACKKSFPDAPTIVTGKVIDENNMPVEDFFFSFSGIQKNNIINGVPTFSERKKTNKQGIYIFSVLISSDTDNISFVPEGYENDFPKTSMVELYIEKIGIYEPYAKVGEGHIQYGQTNTFNFQIRKR
jgi:hypothetical protein